MLDYTISTIFLQTTSLIILLSIYLLIKNRIKVYNENYYKIITLLTSFSIAICSHELVKANYIKHFGVSPI